MRVYNKKKTIECPNRKGIVVGSNTCLRCMDFEDAVFGYILCRDNFYKPKASPKTAHNKRMAKFISFIKSWWK